MVATRTVTVSEPGLPPFHHININQAANFAPGDASLPNDHAYHGYVAIVEPAPKKFTYHPFGDGFVGNEVIAVGCYDEGNAKVATLLLTLPVENDYDPDVPVPVVAGSATIQSFDEDYNSPNSPNMRHSAGVDDVSDLHLWGRFQVTLHLHGWNADMVAHPEQWFVVAFDEATVLANMQDPIISPDGKPLSEVPGITVGSDSTLYVSYRGYLDGAWPTSVRVSFGKLDETLITRTEDGSVSGRFFADRVSQYVTVPITPVG